MKNGKAFGRRFAAVILVTTALVGTALVNPVASSAAPHTATGADTLNLSVGRGRLITLPRAMTDVFVANDTIADVQVRSSTQLYVFAKGPGETSVYATDNAGRVVYSSVIRVGNNIETLDQMLALAMPDANIQVNTMNGLVLLTGTVGAPEDAAEADRLVQAMVGAQTQVVSRLQTATPLQVNLQVRIAEVSRSIIKDIGMNSIGNGSAGTGNVWSIASGIDSRFMTDDEGYIKDIFKKEDGTSLKFLGKVLGLNLNSSLDLAEKNGLISTLAQPNLTTMSGETADFLAGGEYPVPMPNPRDGTVGIEYRKYGVSLSYTPTVLSNGRISMRVRPEVSELSSEGAVKFNGYEIPSLTIRRTETTVELGSGESFMIAGLMSNRSVDSVAKAPGLGDVPILGNLFKSDNFRRGETELVIMITPYLVKPVNANDIRLPTDAFRAPTDLQRVFMNKNSDGVTGGERPKPTRRDGNPTPSSSSLPSAANSRNKGTGDSATPGFDFGK